MYNFISNGKPHGDVASTLMANNFDPGYLRPFLYKGRSFVEKYDGYDDNGEPQFKVVPTNAAATLPRDAWKVFDDAIVRSVSPRLKFVNILRNAGLTYTIPNGMGKTVLETSKTGDITPATVSMDGIRRGDADQPEVDFDHLPLPIIHKDFHFSLRQLETSRNSALQFDTTTAELAGRKVAEEVEKLALGVSVYNGYTYGGGSVYGLTSFPGRMTASPGVTIPTDSGWNPSMFIDEVISMREQARQAGQYGPWRLMLGSKWDLHLESDYTLVDGTVTSQSVRERLSRVSGIQAVDTLDYLDSYDVILTQMTSDNMRMVIGMDVVTVEWESLGGLMRNYKVMCIMVPQYRSDFDGNSGIIHAVPA